jgi:hypothetical protein
MRHSAGEIARQDRPIRCAHQPSSISQSATHASQNAPMTASVVRNASAIRRGCDVGRRTRDARGRSATTPAKSRRGGGGPSSCGHGSRPSRRGRDLLACLAHRERTVVGRWGPGQTAFAARTFRPSAAGAEVAAETGTAEIAATQARVDAAARGNAAQPATTAGRAQARIGLAELSLHAVFVGATRRRRRRRRHRTGNAAPTLARPVSARRPIRLFSLAFAQFALLTRRALLLGRSVLNCGRAEDQTERTTESGQCATARTSGGQGAGQGIEASSVHMASSKAPYEPRWRQTPGRRRVAIVDHETDVNSVLAT